MHTMIFARARDNFQKSRKNLGNCDFSEVCTKADKSQISSVWCFISLLEQYEIVCTLI